MTLKHGLEKALLCTRFALDKKAYDLELLDVSKLTSVADYFLICTGRSDTQARAIAQHLEESLEREGIRPLATSRVPDTTAPRPRETRRHRRWD